MVFVIIITCIWGWSVCTHKHTYTDHIVEAVRYFRRISGSGGGATERYFSFFLGGPIGGICCVASALKASAMRCGLELTICFHPAVSMTSVTWCVLMKSIAVA